MLLYVEMKIKKLVEVFNGTDGNSEGWLGKKTELTDEQQKNEIVVYFGYDRSTKPIYAFKKSIQ